MEGEGSFYVAARSGLYPKAVFQLNMADEDVVRHAHELSGIGTVNGMKPGERSVLPQWRWRVSAQAEVAWLMDALYKYLGIRRRAKIDELRLEVLPQWAK